MTTIESAAQLKSLFWLGHARPMRLHSGDYPSATRTAWRDFVTASVRDGLIDEKLARNAKL